MESSNFSAPDFSSLLKKVKDKELREFMEEYAADSLDFQTRFLLRFADRLQISGKEKYVLLIRKIMLSRSSGAEGVTDESNSKMMQRLVGLLDDADNQIARKDYLDPFYLSVALVRETHTLTIPSGELNELLQGCIMRAFNILDNILRTDAGPDLKEAVFEVAAHEATRVSYGNSELVKEWFNLLTNAATDEAQQLRLLELLDNMINESGIRSGRWTNEQYNEFFLRKKMEVYETMGRKEDARKVIEENLRIRSFRRQLIDEAIANRDFITAKELIKASKFNEQQKGRLYASSEWDELLLRIAQQENDIRSIRNTGLRLFYDRFDIRFYRIVKSTFDQKQWEPEVEKIIDEMRKENNFGIQGIRALSAIFIEERNWERLLQLVQKNASLEFVEDYYALLKDKYPEELVVIYREALRRYAEHNMGREHYEYVVKTLRKIQSLPTGIDVAKSLAIEFKVKYRSRRNMVKALNKLVF